VRTFRWVGGLEPFRSKVTFGVKGGAVYDFKALRRLASAHKRLKSANHQPGDRFYCQKYDILGKAGVVYFGLLFPKPKEIATS
jgi:hypothetical protein